VCDQQKRLQISLGREENDNDNNIDITDQWAKICTNLLYSDAAVFLCPTPSLAPARALSLSLSKVKKLSQATYAP
jgi:hypothetical protein